VNMEEIMLTWRDEGAILADALMIVVLPKADEKVLEEMALWFIITTVKS